MSPKSWQRLVRFSDSLKSLHPQCDLTYPPLAECYYDQSHLTREFRHFAGTTPGEYRRQKALGDKRLFMFEVG